MLRLYYCTLWSLESVFQKSDEQDTFIIQKFVVKKVFNGPTLLKKCFAFNKDENIHKSNYLKFKRSSWRIYDNKYRITGVYLFRNHQWKQYKSHTPRSFIILYNEVTVCIYVCLHVWMYEFPVRYRKRIDKLFHF